MRTLNVMIALAALLLVASGVRDEEGAGGEANSTAGGEANSTTERAENYRQEICGGQTIWKMLTAGSDIRSVRNIKWNAITQIADEYISMEAYKVDSLEFEVAELTRRIEEKQRMEARRLLNNEEVARLLTEAAVPAFGTFETIKQTLCGVPFFRPQAPRYAFEQSMYNFEQIAKTIFNGNVMIAGTLFWDTCMYNTPCPPPCPTCGWRQSCYCEAMCQNFQDIAQSYSDATAGSRTGLSSDQLLDVLRSKKNELMFHLLEVAQCSQDKAYLMAFSEQLAKLTSDMKEKFTGVQDAEYALADAEYELYDLTDALAVQQKEADEAIKIAQASGASFNRAKAALEKVKKDSETLTGMKNSVAKALTTTRNSLQEADGAKDAADGLKMAVSVAMMKMLLYFQEEVQEPVRFTGLDEETDLATIFPHLEDPSLKDVLGTMSEAVNDLGNLCTQEAKDAFAKVSHKVNLSPLCLFGTPDSIQTEIKGAVSERASRIRAQIEEVKSWLNPNKGRGDLSEAKLQEYLDAGEPKGFRDIIGIFYQTQFYKYLQNWQAGGPFLGLMSKLSNRVKKLNWDIQELSTQLTALEEKVRVVVAEQKAATEELARATSANTVADAKKRAAIAKVKEMQETEKTMKNNLVTLTANVQQAKAKLAAAEETLMKTHKKDVTGLQPQTVWSVAELHANHTAAKQEAALLELELYRAKGKKAVVGSQLAMARGALAAAGELKPIHKLAQF